MEKLKKLTDICKCGVHISINEHRNYYDTVESYFKSNFINEEDFKDIEANVYEKMKELDTIVQLQYYPNTPVGFYIIYHYDLEKAIDKALLNLNEKK